ncbi:hypothetical protein DQ226_15525 [Dietzia maris]|uniref:Uncharacterized protein n=2 Tax=Dietzia maris TaxID=37915 RepID=A0A365P752_9ACTN|nr:hypothetical protein DQ226_15525 [Dietzia maris]
MLVGSAAVREYDDDEAPQSHTGESRRPVTQTGRRLLCTGLARSSLSLRYDRGHTFGMSHTTIKVSRDLRDLLKRQAAEGHRTLGDHLAYLASLAEKQRRLERLRAEIDATSPEDLASYREESEWWERAQDA